MDKNVFYLVEKKPPVAWVFLNRPEKKNAMGPEAWTEPVEIFAELDQAPEIRVIIDDGLKYVASVSANIIPSSDLMEALNAFNEKRKPNFTGT